MGNDLASSRDCYSY